MKHLIQAKKICAGNWILFDMTDDKPIGEERAYQYSTRKEAYHAASQMWRYYDAWEGKRVHGGYSIKVD
jgi:hypothetical protein